MKKRLAVIIVLAFVASACGFKNRSGYYFDNHRFNYVRLQKFKNSAGRNINHPYTFAEPQISTLLKMVEIKKGQFFSKDDKIKNIFDSYAIGKMTPAIVAAFAVATPKQKIGFQFLVKNTHLVLRDDRLTSGSMWVEDEKLHVLFDDVYLSVTGDIDKRGYTAIRQAQHAKGLRTELELKPGQEYGSSTHELVVDPAVYTKIAEERVKKEKELAEKGVDAEVKIQVIKDESAKGRLKELDTLRKERMITEEEYQKKRKEILGEL